VTRVGSTLTASRGSWSAFPSATFKYQWYRCTSSTTSAVPYTSSTQKPAGCTLISGATRSTYKVGTLDRGRYLAVRITATNSAGTRYLFSLATPKIR
jgi:hypothetical protein